MVKPSKSETRDAPEPALTRVQRMLDTGLVGLDAYVASTAQAVKASKDPETAEAFAHLLTKVAQVASELRKAEKEARRTADDLSEADVAEWLRRLEGTRRDRLLRELQSIASNAKKSGLA